MGASWTCGGGTWAAAPAAKSSENRRASVTDASGTPCSLRRGSWVAAPGLPPPPGRAARIEERASSTQAERPAASQATARAASQRASSGASERPCGER
eukprot:scaffold29998_cov28-Phaeocystis_antarctica.AAC.1